MAVTNILRGRDKFEFGFNTEGWSDSREFWVQLTENQTDTHFHTNSPAFSANVVWKWVTFVSFFWHFTFKVEMVFELTIFSPLKSIRHHGKWVGTERISESGIWRNCFLVGTPDFNVLPLEVRGWECDTNHLHTVMFCQFVVSHRYSIVFSTFCLIKLMRFDDGDWDNMLIKATAIMLAVWALVEMPRIYLGYAGNLREQVPHLFGFLFMTVFPQSILVLLMMALQWNHSTYRPIDRVLSSIHILFIVTQLVFGYIAIKHVINAQTLKFKIRTRLRAETKHRSGSGGASLIGRDKLRSIDPNDIKRD